ncbi:hypothetical protein BH11GEM1_BH11GEM1_29770 [soil metagenome]
MESDVTALAGRSLAFAMMAAVGACSRSVGNQVAPEGSSTEAATTPAMSPPTWMRGVWTREWIERKGARSSPLDVHYLQTPDFFADVRIPHDRPAFENAGSFADLSDADLMLLAKQKGFAGHVRATGDTITWQHEIDFQPPDGEADIGRVERIGSAQMYEHALDSSYIESWKSVATGEGAFLVIRGTRARRLVHLLVVAGDHFMYVRNREKDLPNAVPLYSLTHPPHASRAAIIAYLDCEFSTGRVRSGSVPWEIQSSTLPWKTGRRLAIVDSIAVTPDASQVRISAASTTQWSVPTNTLSSAALTTIFAHAP